MAREKKTVVIGGTTFEITQLGALKGSRVQVQLAKLLAPFLVKAASGGAGMTVEALAISSVGSFLEGLSDEALSSLRTTFCEVTQVKQGDMWLQLNDAIFDQVFAAKYTEMYEWMLEHVRHNRFDDFLGAIKRARGDAAVAPTTSQ